MQAADNPAAPIHTRYCDHHGWLHRWLHRWLLRRQDNAADVADIAHDVFPRLIVKPALSGRGRVNLSGIPRKCAGKVRIFPFLVHVRHLGAR